MLPLVSILIPTYKRAHLLPMAIRSALAQTYPNIEFVVQDGASTDDTLEILRSYGDRLKVVSEPDDLRGLSGVTRRSSSPRAMA